MRKLVTIILAAAVLPAFGAEAGRKLSYREYLDKVHGGWIGKIAGLTLGVPKEFAEPWPPSLTAYFGVRVEQAASEAPASSTRAHRPNRTVCSRSMANPRCLLRAGCSLEP